MKNTPPRPASLPRKILVAVDAEGRSDHAVEMAARLGHEWDAEVDFLHANPPRGFLEMYWSDSRIDESRKKELAAAEAHLRRHLGEVLADAPGGPVFAADRLHVVSGRPTPTLLARAARMPADLIVLGGSRRRSVFGSGSTARAVLAKSTCPVWIQTSERAPIKRILVAVDLSEESLLALSFARTLAARFAASIEALHAYDLPAIATVPWDASVMVPDLESMRSASLKSFESALAEFDWQGVAHTATFVDGQPAEVVLEAAHSADLVVMGTHGRTGFTATVLGSVAHSVASHSERPVVVVRKHDRVFEA